MDVFQVCTNLLNDVSGEDVLVETDIIARFVK